MCGIVGVAGTGPCSHQMKEFFTQLLHHDMIRGHHATGVAAIDTIDRSLVVEKKAIASPEFLQEKEVMENLFAVRHNFNIYVGHNRFATSGAKDDDDNAHPFIHGDIVGVHNGSLRKQSRLDDHKDFVVDSDNLFYQLNKTGLDDMLTKTDGAFALVWYDRKDNSLNFLRNDERPLAIAKLSNGYWVWASEIGMLRWLVKRHKTLNFESTTEERDGSKIKYDHIFNLEKGVHMKVSFKDKTRQYNGEPEYTTKVLPTFPYEGTTYTTGNYYGGGRRGWQDSRGNTTTTHTPTVTRYAATCQEHLDKFMVGGKMSDTVLEVEFQGVVREKTRTGFEATIAILHFNNKDGQVVKCHAFVHNGTPFLKDWAGDDSKKGSKVYGTICTVTTAEQSTYECTRNDAPLDFSLSLNLLTLTPPKRYFAFGETPGPKSKGGATTGSNVVAIRERTIRTIIEEAAKKVAEKTGQVSEVEGVDPTFMNRKIVLANGECTQAKYLAVFGENGPMCSNCGSNISSMATSRLWRTIWYDRDVGAYQNYLSCSKRCYTLTEEVMKQLDQDYEKRYGGRDD